MDIGLLFGSVGSRTVRGVPPTGRIEATVSRQIDRSCLNELQLVSGDLTEYCVFTNSSTQIINQIVSILDTHT